MSDGGQPEVNKGMMNRRTFMKNVIVGGAAAAILGQSRPPDAATPNAPAPAPDAVETPRQPDLILNQNGVLVYAQDGIPSAWQDAKTQGTFDQNVLEVARQKAIAEQSFQIAQIVKVVTNNPQPTAEAPQTEEAPVATLPEDIVDKEELASRGIEIIGSERVGFHIRQSAFAQGGIMEQYAQGGERKLKLVITDTPTLTREAFADKRYDPIREIIEKNFKTTQALREQTRLDLPDDPDEAKLIQALYEELYDEEFRNWGLVGYRGYAMRKGMETGSPDTDYLFLPIPPKGLEPENIDFLAVKAQPSETSSQSYQVALETRSKVESLKAERLRTLDPSQSYTPPEEYKKLPSHRPMTLEWKLLAGVDTESRDPYFVALHELTHMKRYAALDAGADDLPNEQRLPYYSEQETDWEALGYIERAYDQYKQNGDDSLYPVVLENKAEGYYVIG